MDISEPLKELGEIDIEELRAAILGLDAECWRQNLHRQQEYEVHKSTESVVLVFTDGAGWPNIEVSKEAGWDKLADEALPVMHRIIADHYPPGGTIIRAMAAKLLAGNVIRPHNDKHPSFHHGHRIHVPITTNSRVRFMIGGRPYRLEVGNAYELNNQKNHSVMNKGSEDRITFIFDYVPSHHIHREASG
ncbi:MAG: aspartyl/asparaginyl beta-hydroxylase domain-containing protein [Gammaproteobacteria bacterium]|nr:aspartyl/asparaginyl beta-hydroxylase domain-containing protein [Gammaproteobacteria bacterium]